MDIFGLFILSFISILVGIVTTLSIQYYVLYAYFKKSPAVKSPEKHNTTVDYTLPEELKRHIDSLTCDETKGKHCSLPISLILQFLFHEVRHLESIKCWLYKKLSLEFEELLTKTTVGKFFDSITIKDMHLGEQFPDIRDISVEEVRLDKKERHIETLSLCLNVDYAGNFILCIDGKMKFGKANANLSIKVKKICGSIRLQFTRIPYTHWFFSFYSDPLIDLAVESHFQGRQLQSNITNLIVYQIKKAIKGNHVWPNYKIRYKPFFVKTDPSQLEMEDGEIVPQGQLDVNCVEISRLAVTANASQIYYTFAIDSIPWICIQRKDDESLMTLELILAKHRHATAGVVFKQEQGQVVIDGISSNCLAANAGLKVGDIIISIDGKNVITVPQVAKAIKSSSSGTNVTIRIDRPVDNYIFKCSEQQENDEKSDNEMEALEASLIERGDKNEEKGSSTKNSERLGKFSSSDNVSKFAQTIGSFSLRKRKASVFENVAQKPAIKKPIKNNSKSDTEKTNADLDSKKIFRSSNLNYTAANIVSSRERNDDCQFELKEDSKYLNVNVWACRPEGNDTLLGYANIPLNHILNECFNSVLGHYVRRYSFLPPTVAPPNSQTHPLLSHSGFEHVFCYGDILLSFVWSHEDDVELKRHSSVVGLVDSSQQEEKPSTEPPAASNKHDFMRRQFHRTTQCDFCTKKIWLKDAVQCKCCGMCCHKKCIVKCQLASNCRPPDTTSNQPEITMTEPEDEINVKLINQSGILKRVNSVNNLSIGDSLSSSSCSTRSLPPSPQRTPSRKESLAVVNPFVMCPDVLDEIQKQPEESIEAINRLLEQVLLCPQDEYLMDAAKETGQQLYNHFTYNERTEKINIMMAELKKSLDHITNEHMELTKRLNSEDSVNEKTKIAFLLGKADAKVHGLSVLMLHYCSSLQQPG